MIINTSIIAAISCTFGFTISFHPDFTARLFLVLISFIFVILSPQTGAALGLTFYLEEENSFFLKFELHSYTVVVMKVMHLSFLHGGTLVMKQNSLSSDLLNSLVVTWNVAEISIV